MSNEEQSLTNEELAMLAKSGDKEALHNLYFAVALLLIKLMKPYFKICGVRKTTPDDLLQCRYFIVLAAVKAYAPEKGILFNSYLHHHTQNICLEELGYRGKKQIYTDSLNDPIVEDGSRTLGDSIADPDANCYSYCELSDLQLIVRGEIDKLQPLEQCVILRLSMKRKALRMCLLTSAGI